MSWTAASIIVTDRTSECTWWSSKSTTLTVCACESHAKNLSKRNPSCSLETMVSQGNPPDRYKKTLLDEQFLLHDSSLIPQSSCAEDSNSKEEQKEEAGLRVIVFAAQKNIEILCHSSIWFVDGTFKTTPNIFAQIFMIISVWECTGHSKEMVAVPLVYAFLSGKKTKLYKEVLGVVKDSVEWFHIA